MPHNTLHCILALPFEDRIQLVEDIWDSIAKAPTNVTIPEWHRKELVHRLEEDKRYPTGGSSWEKVRKSILDEV